MSSCRATNANAIDAPEERVPWSCLLSGLSHEEARQVGGILPRHLARVERPDGSETMSVEVRGVERTQVMARQQAEVCAGRVPPAGGGVVIDMAEPWHLVVRGRVLDVHCGSTVEGQVRVTARWLASCPACLAVVEADDARRACELVAIDAAREVTP